MKKIISMLLIISMFQSLLIYNIAIKEVIASEEKVEDYYDTTPKAIPENLILSSAYWGNVTYMPEYVKYQASGSDLNMEVLQTNTNRWWVFGGMSIPAKGKILDFGGFKTGKTYVFQSMVKRLSGEDAIPYYGFALGDGKYNYATTPSTDIYGKDGMAVTSTEWMPFRDTLTVPENYTVTEAGQTLHTGLRVQNTADMGASVAIKKTLVNASVEGSMDTDGFYLAEEAPHDIKIRSEFELSYGENLRLIQNKTLSLTAEVVNQLEIPGKLDQTIQWVVVSSDRQTQIQNITMVREGNRLTLSCDETLMEGRYVAVAISEKYDMVKGIEFDVVKDLSKKYKDFEDNKNEENLIQNPYVSSFATKSSDDVKITAQEGYVTIEALNDIESNLGVEGLKVRNIGNNGLPSSFNFEAGKTYCIKAKVRNPEPENDVYFNASISNSTIDTLSLTNEYAENGMLLTNDWQEFKACIKVSENYDNNALIQNRNFTLGISKGSVKGAKADIELSVSVMEEIPASLTNDILESDAVLTENKLLTFKANLTNQFGLNGSLLQKFEWVALSADRVNEVEGFTFITNDDGTVTVSVTKNTPVGEFVIVVYSSEYDVAKGVNVTVKHEKYSVYVSTYGDDNDDGSFYHPLATLNGAKLFVREKIAEGVFNYYCGIDVIFQPGEYQIANTASFFEVDSGTELNPITYKANGKVVFRGAMDLDLNKAKKITDESTLLKLDDCIRDKVIELDISDYPHDLTRITLSATNNSLIDGKVEYPEIYLNGAEQNLAQWPNGDGEFSKYEYVSDNQFRYTEDSPSKWNDANNWWIGGYPVLDYDYRRMPVVAVDSKSKVITVKTDINSGTKFVDGNNKSKRWKAYNLLEELDEVGEWYINAETKKLYYYPPVLQGNERLEISYLTNNMISMDKTEYVIFDGFEFTKTRADIIRAQDIKNIEFKNCTFSDVGGTAFYCTGSNAAQTNKDYWQRQQIDGAYDCVIENCVFSNIGVCGVNISGGNVDTLKKGNNIIANNFFHKCSQKVRGEPAIRLRGCGNILKKNNISNLPFQAVTVAGNDHIIQYNEIYDVCRESEDCAAIYQGRSTVHRGTVVEYNYLHDLYPLYNFTADRYINAAIYWDDSQNGMTVRKNIIRNAKLGIFNNNGIDNTYTGNTIIDTYIPMRVDVKGASQDVDATNGKTGFLGYIENPEVYYKRYENLKTIIGTDPINSGETGRNLGRFNIVKDNLFVNAQNEAIISSDCGVVENESISECNDFVNPEVQDYRVKLNSDTHNRNNELLNENFDINLIGANKDDLVIKSDFNLYYPYGRIQDLKNLHFIWSEALGATYYILEISQKADFSEIIYSKKVAFNYADVSLDETLGGKFYWRVIAINSSRNMSETWKNDAGEFYYGNVSIENVSVVYAKTRFVISMDIQNELMELIPAVQLYIAGYSSEDKLIHVNKYDVDFDSFIYKLSKSIEKDEKVSYIKVFLWDGMTPLSEDITRMTQK